MSYCFIIQWNPTIVIKKCILNCGICLVTGSVEAVATTSRSCCCLYSSSSLYQCKRSQWPHYRNTNWKWQPVGVVIPLIPLFPYDLEKLLAAVPPLQTAVSPALKLKQRKLNVDNKGGYPALIVLWGVGEGREGHFFKVITASLHRDPSARLPRRLDRPVCTCRRERVPGFITQAPLLSWDINLTLCGVWFHFPWVIFALRFLLSVYMSECSSFWVSIWVCDLSYCCNYKCWALGCCNLSLFHVRLLSKSAYQ